MKKIYSGSKSRAQLVNIRSWSHFEMLCARTS